MAPQPMARQVVLVRHGETEWSRIGRHTSRTDLGLTERGREQAAALGSLLRQFAFDRVMASPKRRACDTATLAGFPDAEVCSDLQEWDYGDYEGMTSAEIRRNAPGWTVWTGPCPGGETLDQVATRADRVLRQIGAASGNALIFGHGHQLRVLAARWCGLPGTAGQALALDPATVSVLAYEHDAGVVRRWNLEGSGEL